MKKHFPTPYKQQLKKVEKLKFFQRGKSMVLVKKCQFLHSVIVGQISQENVFHDILKKKNAFLGYKTRSLKSRKMGVFPKGLVHGFGLKVSIFPSFCFS